VNPPPPNPPTHLKKKAHENKSELLELAGPAGGCLCSCLIFLIICYFAANTCSGFLPPLSEGMKHTPKHQFIQLLICHARSSASFNPNKSAALSEGCLLPHKRSNRALQTERNHVVLEDKYFIYPTPGDGFEGDVFRFLYFTAF